MKLEQWFDIRRLATLLVLAAGAAAQDTQPARIDADATENVAPGVTHRSLRFTLGGSPFSMHILEADPAHHAVNILPVRAQDRAIGKETVLSMAKRFGASAAINGGYFEVPGNYAGTSHGVYFLNGEILTSGAIARLCCCAASPGSGNMPKSTSSTSKAR